MQATELSEAFKKTYLLNGLSPEQIERVIGIAELRHFDGGDTLIRQFSQESDLLLILEGMVRINSFSGERIADAGPGSIIGEMALIDDKPRSATVVSVGISKAAIIPSKELWRLMRDDANLARLVLLNIARVLSARLRAANIQIDLGVHHK